MEMIKEPLDQIVVLNQNEIINAETSQYEEAKALIQIYTVGDKGHIVNIFSDDEAVLNQLVFILKRNPSVSGPDNYIGTPAISLFHTNE